MTSFEIPFKCRLQFKKDELRCSAKLCFFHCKRCTSNNVIQLRFHPCINCVMCFSSFVIMAKRKIIDAIKFLFRSKSKTTIPVWIIKYFTARKNSKACCVHAEFAGHVAKRNHIAKRFTHLFTVNSNPAIHANACWPLLFWKECNVIKDKESEMILDKIFSRVSKIKRVPVHEFCAHFFKKCRSSFIMYSEHIRIPFAVKHIIKQGIINFFRINSGEKMCDCVICHVYCTVT